MTNTATSRTYDNMIERAQELGTEHGHNVGTWVQISSEADARIALDPDGYVETFGPRAPLSGEFADDMTPDKLRVELEISLEDWENDDLSASIMEGYELAFEEAHEAEVHRMARVQLEGSVRGCSCGEADFGAPGHDH
jgi:hypothetical protein